MLRLTLDQINELKSKAKGDGTMHHSTYEILAAHLWRCASKARGLAHDQPTKLGCFKQLMEGPRLTHHYLRLPRERCCSKATPMAKSG
ncbi:hydroxycinnamoyl-CoA:quinate hydroxycinnamoyltransferase [Artemisia annua]|uniref:Hydroxycinnamoyl-CoA:quinate hydroxycinnamoyltransferase n=1 Tax=Artemisia annua TaxID=35608 RepID=A0A2U1M0P0_ARTAN|nr:hydroxycinnamoyl-CoA:quinate hydroxycinnamoyltransferase [Artemisia annua]